MTKQHLKLNAAENAVARLLKERHNLKWPFAAIIARDVVALQVVDGSLSLPLDPGDPPLRKRKSAPGRYAEHERQNAEADARAALGARGPLIEFGFSTLTEPGGIRVSRIA